MWHDHLWNYRQVMLFVEPRATNATKWLTSEMCPFEDRETPPFSTAARGLLARRVESECCFTYTGLLFPPKSTNAEDAEQWRTFFRTLLYAYTATARCRDFGEPLTDAVVLRAQDCSTSLLNHMAFNATFSAVAMDRVMQEPMEHFPSALVDFLFGVEE